MRTLRAVIDRVLACTLATAGCGVASDAPADAGAPVPNPTGTASPVPGPGPSASVVGVSAPSPAACTTLAPSSPSVSIAFPIEPPDPFDTASPDRWEATRFACEKDLIARVQPAVPVDYLSLRAAGPSECGDGCYVGIVEERGAACSGAGDHAACLARTGGIYRTDGWLGPMPFRSSSPQFFLSTRADDVATYATYGELVKFFGVIDNGAEAELLVTLQGHYARCSVGGGSGYAPQADGWDVLVSLCDNGKPTRLLFDVTRDGVVTVVGKKQTANSACYEGVGSSNCGRRPEGLEEAMPAAATTALGALFASVAHLEAASVHAFERLAEELARHGAPDELVCWARNAASEEVRHTEMTTALARRFGGVPAEVQIAPRTDRSLELLAIENAIEGCVRETYGAVVARWQAVRSTDPEIARVMTEIAADETRHAELSWAIARWADQCLDAPARERVAQARRDAARALYEELRAPTRTPSSDLDDVAGLPAPRDGARLFVALSRELALA